jgi:endonuclease/exonuclease/phosphatase family metal-dependent hydrolase
LSKIVSIMRSGECESYEYPGEAVRPGKTLRVASWNLERGYHAAAQGKFLADQAIDVALLQEVDKGCRRTQEQDVLAVLAREAGGKWWGVFCCEFEELDSPKRPPHLAGGGWHGNAILSRFPIVRSGSVVLKQFFDWEAGSSRQPRRGGRVAVWADIDVGGGVVARFYSAHTENYCGAIDRLEQLLQLTAELFEGPLCVGGDLNTLMHGVVRCMPFVYPDRHWLHRFWHSLGKSEAEWLQQSVLESEEKVRGRR